MKLTAVQDLTPLVEEFPPKTRWFPMKVEELLIFAVLVVVHTLVA